MGINQYCGLMELYNIIVSLLMVIIIIDIIIYNIVIIYTMYNEAINKYAETY